MTGSIGAAGRMAAAFINSKLTPLFIIASIALGALAVIALPREEEPQIIVPMIDVMVSMPGASPAEVEQRVTRPMEKLLREVPGVEYVYSTSSPGRSTVIVRFLVGQDEEQALVRLNQKLHANFGLIPPGASEPVITARSIDDVPILSLTLWSERYDDFPLRQIAAQLHDAVKEVPDVSEVTLTGGRKRELSVSLDPARLASYGVDPLAAADAVRRANTRGTAGPVTSGGEDTIVEAGGWLASPRDVGAVVVATREGRPIRLSDIADIHDGATVMIGGFGSFGGLPVNLITAMATHGAKNLTIVSNAGGVGFELSKRIKPGGYPDIGQLFERSLVKKFIGSVPALGGMPATAPIEKAYNEGKIEIEIVPQGTLAERIRAGAGGLGGFYNRVGVGTPVEAGKEKKIIAGKEYILELPLSADFALIKAHKADTLGNLVYKGTARCFNPIMAMAARVTIVEVDKLVQPGELDPEVVVTPHIYVHRIVEVAR